MSGYVITVGVIALLFVALIGAINLYTRMDGRE